MSRVRILNLFFATLIFVAHLHCVVEHHAPASRDQIAHVVGKKPNRDCTPIAPQEGNCDDKTGCICKGATVVEAVPFEETDFQQSFVPSATLAPSFLWLSPSEQLLFSRTILDNPAPPVRALDRRIALQSFQI